MTTVLFDYTNRGASALPRCYDISSVRVLVVGDRGVGKSTLIENLFASSNIKNLHGQTHEHGFQGFHGFHEVRGNRVFVENGCNSEDLIHKKTDYTNLVQSKNFKEFKDKDINCKCLFSDFASLHENDGEGMEESINHTHSHIHNEHNHLHVDGDFGDHHHEHMHTGHSGYKFLQQFPQIFVKDYSKMKFNCDLSLDVQIVETSNESFQNYFSDIKRVQIHQTDIFLLCFDPTQPQSLENLKTTFSILITNLDPMEQSYEYSIYFVCTKADNIHYKNYYLQIKEFLQNFKLNILKNYYVVSSKTGYLMRHPVVENSGFDSEDNEDAVMDESEDDNRSEEDQDDFENGGSDIDFAVSIGSPRSNNRRQSRSQSSFSPLLHHPKHTRSQKVLSVDELFFRMLKNYEAWRSYCRNGTWDAGVFTSSTNTITSGTLRSASPDSSARYSSIYPTSVYMTASARNTPTLSTSDSANNSNSNIALLNHTASFVSAPAVPTHPTSMISDNNDTNSNNNNNKDNINNNSATNLQESSTKSLFVVSSDVKKSSFSSSNILEQKQAAMGNNRVAEIKSPVPIQLSKQNSLQRTTQELENETHSQETKGHTQENKTPVQGNLENKTSNTNKINNTSFDFAPEAQEIALGKAQTSGQPKNTILPVTSNLKKFSKTTSNKEISSSNGSNAHKSIQQNIRKTKPPTKPPTKQKSDRGGCCIIM